MLSVHDLVWKYNKTDTAPTEPGRPSRQRDFLDLVETRFDYNPEYSSHMVADVSRHGVREPIGVDTRFNPPMVTDGHNRLMAAYLTGMRRIPVREVGIGMAEDRGEERYRDTVTPLPKGLRQ